MSEILKGKLVAQKIKDEIIQKVSKLKEEGKFPTLAIIRLGNNPNDISYEKGIIKNCNSLDVKSIVFEREESISTEDLIKLMDELNNDNNISGILLFRPLPKHIDEEKVRNSINPRKDVDCMHPLNLEKVFEGNMKGFLPCTPLAAMNVLTYNEIPLEGKNVVVINRSMVVGKPLVMMLLEKNATVTICHSKTKDLDVITRNADVVITALGRPKLLTQNYFTNKSIVIDVGVSETEDGKLSGDVDFDNVVDVVDKITPVIGGVGSVTSTILINQVVNACIDI